LAKESPLPSTAACIGDVQLAVKVARLACEAEPHSVEVWLQRLEVEQQQQASRSSRASSSARGKIWEVVLQGLQEVPLQHSAQLWLKVGVEGIVSIV
jgi:hypothetical protein